MTCYQGLSTEKAKELMVCYGRNEIRNHRKGLKKKLMKILTEPIYLLLTFAAVIYFLLGEAVEGMIMIGFVLFVIGIDLLQDLRTGNALKKLKEISTPRITVVRDGRQIQLPGTLLVPGDLVLLFEGVKIPADGYLLSASGLCIDESILTGESCGVWKQARQENSEPAKDILTEEADIKDKDSKAGFFQKDYCYTGTLVILGTGSLLVEKTGNATEYGKIAENIREAPLSDTPLQVQMKKLAGQCTGMAAVVFLFVCFFTFLNLSGYQLTERIIHSLLAGVVLALSMIPGEFPVILSVFLSMGALRLARNKTLVRHLPSVETLGAVSVICMDKTGTITKNKLEVIDSYVAERQEGRFCRIMGLSCKEDTCDPVETAMLEYGRKLCSCCSERSETDGCDNLRHQERLVKEYAFTNELKAMGQVWEDNGNLIIAAKGSPEKILSLCRLTSDKNLLIKNKVAEFLKKGLRVIAIADCVLTEHGAVPESLTDCEFFLRGIIGLSDPARDNIQENITACYHAGIRTIMITGDHPTTAAIIAKEVGIKISGQVVTGDQIDQMSEERLKTVVTKCNLFARVLPLHKMRIVKALKENGEIVAMTGDGVNDSPALRMADIGIAMGEQGSEVCREAADIILLDDNFSTILEAIKDGRRIYQNILKTIGYVLTIHIPIALISLAAPLLGISPDALMLQPLHIVLLELIMDPTCSVALERQPADDNIMDWPPRRIEEPLMTKKRLKKSCLQGFILYLFSFGSYLFLLLLNYPSDLARTAGFAVLVIANILLVFANCSETESIFGSLKKIGKDRGIWLLNLLILIGLCCLIYGPFHMALGFRPLSLSAGAMVIALSALSVLWYELVKLVKRIKIKLYPD